MQHLASARLLREHGLLRDSIARLYYSAFSLMVAVCGEPPSGRWKHKGILKEFFRRLNQVGIRLDEESRELLIVFYDKRREADYTLEDILLEEVVSYENLVNRLFEVVDDWREKQP